MAIRTFEAAVRIDGDEGRPVHRRRRASYTACTIAVVVVLGLAVVDGLDLVDVVGVDTAHVRASGGGYDLDVTYGTVSRSGLATPFEIEIRRDGGFDGPISVAVDAEYLSVWDENGLDPDPASATADESSLIWEFEPPDGEVLVVSFDARIEPAAQRGRSGSVAVLEDGEPVTSVSFTTRVMP